MKKQAMVMALLSAGLMSQAVNAAPSSSVLEWRGFVPGAFAGSDMGLTGQGGGDIQTGELTFDESGNFSTVRSIIVEAHAMDATDPTVVDLETLYEGSVDWTISAPNVSHAAYDASGLTFTVNGDEITPDGATPVTTLDGAHTVGFSVSGVPSDAALLTPGDVVSVTAMVFAEPHVVTTP